MSREVVLAARPQGEPKESDFEVRERDGAEPGDGEVLVRNEFVSVDPYMRGRMTGVRTYVDPYEIGDAIDGGAVGRVTASRHDGFAEGDWVLSMLGWREEGIARGDTLRKLDPELAPPSTALGVLGMPGMTAYFGLKEIGQPKPGETVVVSAASGAVGSVVGQLAKIAGCRAVGIAGGREKCDYVTRELGFDACVDYKTGSLADKLKEACPKGIDVYFENVGGEMLDTVLAHMNLFSRLIVCGMISQYNVTEPYGVKNLRFVLTNRIRVQGMIVFDWKDRYGEALAALAGHLAQKKLKYRESVVQGLENAPRGLIELLQGKNFGKQLVKL